MATVIQIKRSSGSTAPTTSDLAEGELAYSQDQSGSGAAAKLYIESVDSDGSTAVIHTIGGKYYTDAIDAATDSNTASTIVERDGSGDFSAGTITAGLTGDVTGDLTGNVTGNVTGDVTGNADTATALETGRTISISGDMTYTSPTFDGTGNVTAAGTLATVNSNVGSFGSTTAVPVVTVNAKGLVTAVTTAAIATSFDIDADSGTADTVAGGETITFNGTANEIETAVADNAITIGLPNDVTIGNDLTVTNDATVSGNATITGNLTVNGTTTTLNTTNSVVSDTLIELGNGVSGAPANDSGLVIERGDSDNAFIGFDESADKFIVGTGTFTGASTGNLTISTGTLVANLEGNVSGGTVSSLSAAIAVGDGGTGATTFTSNGIVYGNGTSALQATAAGTDGYILYSNSGTPDWTNTLDGGTY